MKRFSNKIILLAALLTPILFVYTPKIYAEASAPNVTSFTVSTTTLTNKGGSVTEKVAVKNAKTCIFVSKNSTSGVVKKITKACNTGTYTNQLVLPNNSTTLTTSYKLYVNVIGSGGNLNSKTITITVKPQPPIILSVSTSSDSLPSSGGYVDFSANVSPGSICTLNVSADRKVDGFPSMNTINCLSGKLDSSIILPNNPYSSSTTYSFSMIVSNDSGWVSKIVKVKVQVNGPVGYNVNLFHIGTIPGAMVSDGSHLWVASEMLNGNPLTELDLKNGAIIQTITDPSYKISQPYALEFDGTHIWILNKDDTITEINASDGSMVAHMYNANYGIQYPADIKSDGTHIWLSDTRDNTIAEINISDRTLVRLIKDSSYKLNSPYNLVSDGNRLWVGNKKSQSITLINELDGSLAKIIDISNNNENYASQMVFDGANVWAVNGSASLISELGLSGNKVRTIQVNSVYSTTQASIAVGPNTIWVSNAPLNSLTEFNKSDGAFSDVLTGSQSAFSYPNYLIYAGGHVWVANNTDYITEF